MNNFFDKNLEKYSDKVLAVDIETTGLDWKTDRIVTISYYGGGKNEEIKYSGCCDVNVGSDKLRLFLKNPENFAIFHNGNFDLKFLESAGFEIGCNIVDTLLLAQLANENEDSFKLKTLSVKYLSKNCIENAEKLWEWLENNKLSKDSIHKAPEALLKDYAIEDARNTYDLAFLFKEKLLASSNKLVKIFGDIKTPIDYFNDEMQPSEFVLRKMEMRGVDVNLSKIYGRLYETKKKYTEIVQLLENISKEKVKLFLDSLHNKKLESYKSERGRKNAKYPIFNWASNKQIGRLLFEYYNLKSIFPNLKTLTGEWKCDEPSLREIKESKLTESVPKEIAHNLLLLSNLKHIISTKIGDVDQYGNSSKGLLSEVYNKKVYPSYKQVGGDNLSEASGTVTGRISSAHPNLQNLDSDSKDFFIPSSREKCFISFDYSQIELRIAAHLSKDPEMTHSLRNGADLHTKLAKLIFNTENIENWQRQVGKQSNFLMIFNGSANRLKDQLKDVCGLEKSLDECKAYRKGFFDLYPVYSEYLKAQKKFMLDYKIVISISGRLRRLPNLKFSKGLDYNKETYNGEYTQELDRMLSELKPSQKIVRICDNVPIYMNRFFLAKRLSGHALNQGFNFPIQSYAASIMKKAMLALNKRNYDIVNQVHDDIVVEVYKNDAKKEFLKIKEILENIVELNVPLLVDGKIINSFDKNDVSELR